MGQMSVITFEQKLGVAIPESDKIHSRGSAELNNIPEYETAGILVKAVAYLIDLGLVVFVVPLFFNIYGYFKWGQTLGQKIMGIRVYDINRIGCIASIPQLLSRMVVKFLFLLSWAVVGMTITILMLNGYPYGNDVHVTYHMFYILVMLIWVHGYVFSMFTNKQSRGTHDIFAKTVVAYDIGYSVRMILLGTIFCACLYYFLLVSMPIIIEYYYGLVGLFDDPWYWNMWYWIDSKVVAGVDQIDL